MNWNKGGVRGSVLDVRNDHGSGLIGEFADGLEGERVADSGDIGKRLEDIGVADRVTVIEQNHRRHGSLSRDDGRDNMGLGVRDIGRERSSSLSSQHPTYQINWKWEKGIPPRTDQDTSPQPYKYHPRSSAT